MNDTANRLLQYGGIFIASIATLISSLIGAMYVSFFLKIESNISATAHIFCILGFICGLTIIFKRASPLHRFIGGSVLLALAILLIPAHNCGSEC